MIKNLLSSDMEIIQRLSKLKIFGFFLIAFLTSIGLKAQTMPYTFLQSSGTYSAISGGTVFQSGVTVTTDGVSGAITLPFTFVYNGVSCDRIYISNNGFITLANAVTTTAPTATTYNPISSATGYIGAVAGYAFNLERSTVASAAAEIRYETLNITPNRVFVIQYTDMARSTNPASERLTFQIRLSETSNKIDIIYNTPTVAATGFTATNFGQVGLRGATNNSFSNRMVYATAPYNTWASSGAAGNNGATQSVTTAAAGGPNVMPFSTTYKPSAGLTYTWTPVSTSFYQTLPYTQNFESTWQNGTSVQDLPASTGVLTMPGTGNGSVRANDVTAANSVWNGTSGSYGALGTAQGSRAARFHAFNYSSGLKAYMDFYMDFSSIGAKQLVFDYINPTGTDVLNIYLSTDGGLTFGSSLLSNGVATGWTSKSVSLGSSVSSTCVVRFEFTSDFGNDDIGVDNINVSVLNVCTTPTAPTLLNLTTASATSITGSFTASSPAPSGYIVVRSTSSSLSANPVDGTTYTTASTIGGGNVISVGTGLTITNTGLTSNTKYYYYVFAYNNTSCSGGPKYSASLNNSGTGQVTCAAAPTAATTPVTSITSGSATINWVASAAGGSAGTINYTVEVYTDSGYTTPIAGSPFNAATATSQAISFTNAAITYYYRIKANNGSCDSTYLTGSFIPTCAAPTALAASATVLATGSGTISGSFTATGGTPPPTGYLVVRSTSPSLPTLSTGTTYTVGANTVVATNGYVEYVGTTAGSWTSTSLSGGVTYYYFVFSYNNTSCSAGPIYSATATQNNATTPACPTFSSVISIGGSTTTPGSLYPTLTSAIADLASCGITQATTLSINGSYTSASEIFPIVIPAIAGSNTTNTLTIKPASGVSPTISGAAASNSLIKINGGSNVIIDGSNSVGGTTKDLSITNTSTTTPNVILIGSPNTTPLTNVTLKNTIITNGANNSSALLVSSSVTVGDPGYFNNITIQNNTVRKAYSGIYVNANTVANNGNGLLITGNDLSATGVNSIRLAGIYVQGVDGTSVISNNTISNISNSSSESPQGIWIAAATNKASVNGNTISNLASTISGNFATRGIYITSGSTTSAHNIYNNTVSGISSLASYINGSAGIEISGVSPNVNLYGNKISNVKNNNTGAYGAAGIFLGSTSTASNTSVYNNMIWDVAAYGDSTLPDYNGHGIFVNAGAGYKIYFNSVNITTNQIATTGITAALYVGSGITTANALDVRNNIFANSQTNNTRYAFYSAAAKTVYSNINYNDYYSTGTLAYLGAARANLAALQATTGTGQDANSLNIIPPFTSATNLLIPSTACTTLVNAGTPISGITTDIENETRSATTPDMGADEFAGNIPPKVATVTGGSNCGAGTVVLGATGTSAGTPITEYRLYTASTGGTAVATSSTGTITTPSITTTTNYYIATFNGCESETRTLVTATINPAPTDIVLTPTISPAAADECSLDYVKLEASGGLSTTMLTSGSGTSTSSGSVTTTALGPNPLQNFYGGTKQQWIYRPSELTTLGFSTGTKIKSIQLNLATADTTYTLLNLKVKMKNSSTTAFASATAWESGLTTVRNAASYTPAVGANSIALDTEFVWDGTSSLVVEINYSNNNDGTAGSTYNTAKYSATGFVSTIFYRVDLNSAVTVDAFTGTASFTYSSRNDISFGIEEQKIIWSPATGLYTDTALTVPYVGGTNATTLYAAPTASTSYTATATQGTCNKVVSTANIQRLKKEFRGPGTDWNTAANWFPAQVPDNSKCASIPATQTVEINGNAEAKSITIAATGKTTVKAGHSLTVTDAINITNNATNENLILESDANLLQTNAVTNSGKMLAKRNVHMRRTDYTYWSSPVKDQPLLNTLNGNLANSTGGFSEGSPNNRTFQYNESDDKFYATPDATFIDAKGYAIRGKSTYDASTMTEDTNLKFVGTPNNGSYSINVKKSNNTGTGGTVEHGYNLIGNPYPSNMDFVKFFYLGNNSNIINAKAWFWSNVTPTSNQSGAAYSGNNYATITLAGSTPPTTVVTASTSTGDYIPSKNIKVGQAFIVQAKNLGTNQTLTYDNTIRTNEAGVFFNNKGASDVNRYWVMLTTPENIVNTILIGHMTGATNNYDANYDADILSIGDDSFYSKLNTQKLQIQARQNLANTEDVIPLGAKYATNGTYKISVGVKEGIFATDQKVYLLDKLNNLYTDLTAQDYIFTANKGTDETRFEIVYKNKEVLATDGVKKSDFLVYRDGESYVIRSSESLGKVELYDASGKLIVSKSTTQKELRLDAHTIASGVYIIKAENSGNIRTKKILK